MNNTHAYKKKKGNIIKIVKRGTGKIFIKKKKEKKKWEDVTKT
jgi:hypothetical protein